MIGSKTSSPQVEMVYNQFMALRLVYGRARSGKTTGCFSEMMKLLKEGFDKPLILIVPEQFSLEAEKSLTALTAVNAEVLSFKRLAYRILNETGGAALKRLNTPGRLLLLSRTIRHLKDEMEILSPSAAHNSFAGIMSSTISELKRYNITCGKLKNLVSQIGNDNHLGKKLSEIYSVYSGFQAELEGRYRDMDDDLADVSRRIAGSQWLQGACVWVDEFSSFTPQEYLIIGELIGVCKAVTVTLCMDDPRLKGPNMTKTAVSPVFAHISRTADRLASLAAQSGAAIKECSAAGPAGKDSISPELAHLEQNLYTYPSGRYVKPVKDMEIFIASSQFSEVENCAGDIIRLCREDNLRFRDILIALGDADAYGRIISVVFPLYGIPFFIDAKKPVERNPLIEFIKCSLEIICGNWRYGSVFRYLKTGLADISRDDVDLLENYVLAYGIKGSMWFDDDCWKYPTSDSTAKINIAGIRDRFVKPVRKLAETLKGEFDARHACLGLYEFLCDAGIPGRLERIIDTAKVAGELAMADEYRQVWKIVMDVLDQFAGIYSDEMLTADSFSEALSAGFTGFEIGLVPPSLDQVVVGTVERSRSKATRVLYILGANDGFFPAPPRNEGIISDAERARISDCGVELAQDTRSKVFEDEFSVYRVLSRAGRRLVLSCAIADSEGRSLRPSSYISRIKRIFPGITERSNVIFDDTAASNMSLISAPGPSFDHLVSFMRRSRDGFTVNPLWDIAGIWYRNRREWDERLAQANAALDGSTYAATAESRAIAALYGDNVYAGISRIESYIACPFSFYVKYGLRARERDVFRLEPPDVGTFMHEAINRFFGMIAEMKKDIRGYDHAMCSEAVDGIVDQMLAEMPVSIMKSSKRHSYISGRLKRIIARSIYMTSEHYRRSGFEPFASEMVFGGEGRFPYIEVPLSFGRRLLLTGRIDRVDILDVPVDGQDRNERYVSIIDYKSGRKDFDLSDAYHGLQLQLIAYMDAICSAWSADMPVYPGGILYYHLDDPIVKAERSCGDDEANRVLMKELRMKGLVLNDAALIREMDRQADGASIIIPAALKNGSVSARSSAATPEQFALLRRHVLRLLKKTGDGIVKGRFHITPYKKKNVTACTYCEYLPVCRFEPALTGKGYRVLRDFPDAEVWNLMEQEDGK